MEEYSDDDLFESEAQDNFAEDAECSNITKNLSTEQHYKNFSSLINDYISKMSESKSDDFYHNCQIYSSGEPINLNYEPIEIQTGIFDIVKQDNLFVNKIVQTSILNSKPNHMNYIAS